VLSPALTSDAGIVRSYDCAHDAGTGRPLCEASANSDRGVGRLLRAARADVAAALLADAHWRFTLEWLRVVSSSFNREEFFGGPPFLTETQVQLAIRYAVGSAIR
jgi:hypothetical protein